MGCLPTCVGRRELDLRLEAGRLPRPDSPTCYLSLRVQRSFACAWRRVGRTEAGAKWRLSWLLGGAMLQAQCCVFFATGLFPDLENGYERGLWLLDLLHQKVAFNLQPSRWVWARWCLSSPSEEPAFTPQMDDAGPYRVAQPQAWGRREAEGKEEYFSFSTNQAQVYAANNITTTSITILLMMMAAIHC